MTSTEGWLVRQDRTEAASGKASLRVEPELVTLTDNLFAAVPEPGEVYALDLGLGLTAQVPLSLPEAVASAASRVRTEVVDAHPAPSFDALVGVADVIVLWNTLEHFWPYWDLVTVHWSEGLDASLARALGDRDGAAHQQTMERLSAQLPDGHAGIECEYVPPWTTPALDFALIDDRVIVADSDIPDVHVGDEVVELDGVRASVLEHDQLQFVSGSPQWRTVQALQRLGMGTPGSTVVLHVRRDDDGDHVIRASRPLAGAAFQKHYRYQAITRFDDGIYYIDLSRIQPAELEALESKLATAPGIVFDMRERPIESRPLLSHLLTEDIVATQFFLPQIIRPDHGAKAFAAWQPGPWQIAATRPHFGARIAFVTDAATISLPETYLGLVAHYHLGEIVGGATAGTDGDRAELVEPSGCVTSFTGVRTTNFDGSRFHLIGVRPTIPAVRTVAGVRAGRDELLEKALTYARTGAR